MCQLSWREDGWVLGYCFSMEITCRNALGADEYPIAQLKANKAYGKT